MKKEQQKKIEISAATVAFIILLTSLLPWLMYLFAFTPSRTVNLISFLLFPHEVLGSLKYVLLVYTRSYQLSMLPYFSILFAIFLFIAVVQFHQKQNKRPLAIACAILLVSILISIPETIVYYKKAVIAYNNYKPTTNKGILGLIDNFTAMPKPSLSLLLGQLAILLIYMGWAVWILHLLYGTKHK